MPSTAPDHQARLPRAQFPALTLPAAAQPDTLFTFSDLPKAVVARWNPALQLARREDDEEKYRIDILDFLGPEDWGGISDKTITRALQNAAGRDVVVNINSPGGSFFTGTAIYNLFRAYAGQVTMRVIGLAASAASVVAMAGDRVEVGRAAFLMMHNAWLLVIGNRHDLRAAADMVEPFDDAIAGVYAARTGRSKRAMAALMDATTWLNGTQAVEQDFADSLLPADLVTEKERRDDEDDDDPQALVRQLNAALLKGGTRRDERVGLMNRLRNSMMRKETLMTTTVTPPAALAAAPAPAAPAVAAPAPTPAPAAAPAPAVTAATTGEKEQRERIKNILNSEEAKGREALASHLALETSMSADEAKGILAKSPKTGSRLDAAMHGGLQPRVASVEVTDTAAAPAAAIDSAETIYARRREAMTGQSPSTSRGR